MKRLQLIAALALLIQLLPSSASPGVLDAATKIGDAASVGVKAGKGIIKQIPDLIPTPSDIFGLGKQAIIGLPQEVLAAAVVEFCSLALNGDAIQPKEDLDIHKINMILLVDGQNVSVPVLESNEIWTSKYFDASKKVVIFVTGFLSNVNTTNNAVQTVYAAYKARGDVNFVFLDTDRYVDTLYTWSAFNTQGLGEDLALGLQKLIKYVPLENIHVVGHSLGAHISGVAGATFQYLTGKSLPRITGLDPANPCFKEGEALTGLSRGNADFVDVIHTNSKVLGKRDPVGDADFYPNGVVSVQPGCRSAICSHSRAWELYAETVYPHQEYNMMGTRCNSIKSLKTGKCSKSVPIPMGYDTPSTAKGDFFLETNAESPFGKDN